MDGPAGPEGAGGRGGADATAEMAVFPLGSVLLPGQLLAVQVFEPRYKVMLFDLREQDPAEFAVVLIERGSEVGGGDVRSRVGCVARILGAEDSGDGRVFLVAVGTDRVGIEEWLDEDPYPRALLRRLPDADGSPEIAPSPLDPSPLDPSPLDDVTARARRVGELVARLGGEPWPEELDVETGRVQRIWQLALLTPLATFDRQRLLEIDDPADRLVALDSMLVEQEELLTARIRWDAGGDP